MRVLDYFRTTRWLLFFCSLLGVILAGATVSAQSTSDNLDRLDRLSAQMHAFAAPGLDRSRLSSVARNWSAFADRWEAARGAPPFLATGVDSTTVAATRASARPASQPSLTLTRYAGFTQNQTSTAWCGGNVLTAFNDTGSEVRTIAGSAGISVVGLSSSSDQGSRFTYMGTPLAPTGFYQSLLGAPTLACADNATFFYSAIWSDTQAIVSGIAIGKSTDGGIIFGPPSLAVSKNGWTNILDHDWLAIDPNNHSAMYLTYADLDFSGAFCGTNPNSMSSIPRYAIELVASSDGGATWSTPTVIEQVCATSASPWAAVIGPQVAVGPHGEVYVAYEAAGENGAAATARQIRLAKSSDSGASFGAPTVVAAVTPVGDGADLQGFIRANEFPSLAVGKGSKNSGVVYLAWNDGALSVPDTLTTTTTYAFSDIEFSSSHDGGVTWSTPALVNDNPKSNAGPLNDQFEPTLATDLKGDVAICFYDRRRDPNNFLIDRECAKSTSGGASWRNQRITTQSFGAVVGQDRFVSPDYMGDYDTTVSDSTNSNAGFIDSYASSAAGNPNVMCHKY
jgi:hypothetical protein